MTHTTAAFVGVTGGAGTTRTTLETAVALAAEGLSVAVLDAAYATQGLGDYVSGTIDPDMTALVTDRSDAPLTAGLVDLKLDGSAVEGSLDGRVACCPAVAPFERLARAQGIDAAKRFEERIEEAAATFDHVLVDVPPIASNQAVAAATACERVCLVAPEHGRNATTRLRERLADLGTAEDVTVGTRGAADEADVRLPSTDADVPACLVDDRYGRAMRTLVAALFDRELTVVGAGGGLFSGVRGRVRR